MYVRYRRRRPWATIFFWLLLLGAVGLGIAALFYPKADGPCTNPLDDSCIPNTLSLDNLTVSHWTNLTGETKLHGDVICHTPIWPSCLDISGQGCMTPIQESCLPSEVANWNVTNTLMSQTTVLKGETTCLTSVDPSCIPSNLTLDSLVVNNLTAYDFTHVNMIEMNETLIVTEYLVVNKSMTCGMEGAIDPTCVDISGETCTSPIDPTCVPTIPTSKLTCDVKLDKDCLDISGHGVCSAPIDPSCLPTPNITCSTPLEPGCIPPDLVLNTLTVTNLTAETIIHTTILEQNMSSIVTDYLTVNQSMTCLAPGAIELGCLADIPTSKLACDVKLGTDCVDISGHGTCSSPVDGTCVDISGKSCSMPINANCVDISGETCTAPVDASCLPVNDVQAVALNDVQVETSSLYVDMPGMVLTTANAGTGRYMIFANMQLIQSSSSASIFIILNLNGVDQPLSERVVQLETGNFNLNTFQEFAPSLANGDVVKVRWHKSGPGDITVTNRRFIIQQV